VSADGKTVEARRQDDKGRKRFHLLASKPESARL